MDSAACVERNAIVEEVGEKSILVRLIQESACGNCSSKAICLTGKDGIAFEIDKKNVEYKVGEQIKIGIARSLGQKAIILGYLIPFIFFFSTLIIATQSGMNELSSGLVSLGILVPYYFILYFFKGKLKKSFTFSILKK